VTVEGAVPFSPVCYPWDNEDWMVARADDAGAAVIDFGRTPVAGLGGWRQVLYQSSDGAWLVEGVLPGEHAAPSGITLLEIWRSIVVRAILLFDARANPRARHPRLFEVPSWTLAIVVAPAVATPLISTVKTGALTAS
jgi:hypothetical protein